MEPRRIRTALISVYDKTGIVDFARALVTEFGIEIISTGGTAKLLKENGLPVTLVEEITGFPELLDGRVKTLHPKIFAGILADRDNPEHMRQLDAHGIKPIDMVVVNLYPFAKTVEDPNCTLDQATEMIDIGGVALLRAAAKNWRNVMIISSTAAYENAISLIRDEGSGIWLPPDLDFPFRGLNFENALWTFETTCHYDGEVMAWFSRVQLPNTPIGMIEYRDWGPLKYGENPHQKASMWRLRSEYSIDLTISDQVGGHDFQDDSSLTNYLDLDAGVSLCSDIWRGVNPERVVPWEYAFLEESEVSWPLEDSAATSLEVHCVSIMKHTNACGVGIAHDRIEAYRKAYLGNPKAAMGGMLICSFPIDVRFIEAVMNSFATWGKAAGATGFFLDGWGAPEFSAKEYDNIVNKIRSLKEWGSRTRLYCCEGMEYQPRESQEYRSLHGGMLTQQVDTVGLNESDWKVVTKRKPTDDELADLRLSWLIAKHTKSNAISICKDGMLIGNGAGQMSRVMSCRIATWLAKENGHESKLPGSVAASDGFFPFDDGPKLLMDAGVTAIIQPGGSKRDEEVIRACDGRDVAMIFTGIRHFKH